MAQMEKINKITAVFHFQHNESYVSLTAGLGQDIVLDVVSISCVLVGLHH